MRPALKIRELLPQYQQKLKPDFNSRPAGLEREIKPSRQAADTFDAASLNRSLRLNGYSAAQDFSTREYQTLAHYPATTD